MVKICENHLEKVSFFSPKLQTGIQYTSLRIHLNVVTFHWFDHKFHSKSKRVFPENLFLQTIFTVFSESFSKHFWKHLSWNLFPKIFWFSANTVLIFSEVNFRNIHLHKEKAYHLSIGLYEGCQYWNIYFVKSLPKLTKAYN